MDQEGIKVMPVMFAEATPGGIIDAESYRLLLTEMMLELDKVLPVDGCLVIPHGAAVSESFSDMDGHWLSTLRNKLGDQIPIIGTLDPHANLSRLMVDSTDGLIAYKTNPHTDQRETGRRAAGLMLKILREKCIPVQLLFEPPLIIPIDKQHTGAEPCKSLCHYVDELSGQEDILSISFLIGFPYADVKEMGTSFLVISKNKAAALAAGHKAVRFLLDRRGCFRSSLKEIEDLIPAIRLSKKPVLLLDMGDNIGGGAPGNSVYLLKVFEKHPVGRAFICLYDPGAVIQAERHADGGSFELVLNAEDGDHGHTCRVTVLNTADGQFTETAPRHGGQTRYNMGRIAMVMTRADHVMMLTSIRIPPFSLKQLTHFGVRPEDYDILIAKGVNAPIAAYQEVCPSILQVDTPGVTRANLRKFAFLNRRRPMFPFEEINTDADEI
jgi:microcystin degradation protein MlrC